MAQEALMSVEMASSVIGSSGAAERRIKFIHALAMVSGVTPSEAVLMCVEQALRADVFALGEVLDCSGARDGL